MELNTSPPSRGHFFQGSRDLKRCLRTPNRPPKSRKGPSTHNFSRMSSLTCFVLGCPNAVGQPNHGHPCLVGAGHWAANSRPAPEEALRENKSTHLQVKTSSVSCLTLAVGIWNPDKSGFWMVEKKLGYKWSGFRAGSPTIWKSGKKV